MIRRRFAGMLLMGWLVMPVVAADWPQWRGPQRDGISRETGLLDAWPAGGPRQIWKTEGLGQGYAALAIAQGKLFTQGQRGDRQFVLALALSLTGSVLLVFSHPCLLAVSSCLLRRVLVTPFQPIAIPF